MLHKLASYYIIQSTYLRFKNLFVFFFVFLVKFKRDVSPKISSFK